MAVTEKDVREAAKLVKRVRTCACTCTSCTCTLCLNMYVVPHALVAWAQAGRFSGVAFGPEWR